MKITHLSKKLSTANSLVFVTDKPITESIWAVFHADYLRRIENGGITVEMKGGCLQVNASTIPDGFDQFLTQLLASAEGVVEGKVAFAEQQKLAEAADKEATLQRAAKRISVPMGD